MLYNVQYLRRYSPKRLVVLFAALVFVAAGYSSLIGQKQAVAAANSTINFQARLMNATGSIAPDGYYNVEFKLYDALTSSGSSQGSCTGDSNCLWTETYYDTNGVTAGNDFRVRVVNGYLTVSLGSRTSFPSTIKWGDQLWITMNIGGTTQTATPTYDGEMSPRLQLTAVPYAFSTSTLSGGTGSNITVLDAGTPSGSNVLHLPAETGTLCVQSSSSCGFVAGSASNFIQNGTTVQTGANFNIRSNSTSSVTGVLQGANGQTADLLDVQTWNGSVATTVFGVGNTGDLAVQSINVAANKSITLASGTGTYTQTYSNTSGVAATFNATDSASSGTTAVQGVAINLTGTNNASGSNGVSGLVFGNVAAATNNAFHGIDFGTGFTDLLRYNGTALISGTGVVQSAAISGSYTGITGVGTLTAGTLGAGFTTVAVGQGGTGATTLTSNGVLYGSGTSAIQATAAGTTGQCLVGNTGSAPSWSSCLSSVSLQSAYVGGNTISTSSNDIGFTLNGSDNFTVATIGGGTGSTTFSLTNGSNATPPSQLVLITNNDTDEPVAAGLKITSAAGGITNAIDLSGANITNAISLGSNKILGTTAVIDFNNFDVSSTGAITAVGVNSGTGLIQGTGGLTITGTTSINNNSNNNTSINTGTSTGTVSIGNGSAGAIAIQSGSTIGITGTNFSASTGGVVNVTTGYQIGGAATTGNYLRGNGTNFVSSTIQSGDIPVCTGSCNYISNQTTQQSSANFNISGTGIAGIALQAPLIQTADGTGASASIVLRSGNATTSGNTGDVTIASGAATSGNSGNVSVDSGTASGTKGTVSLGNTNATTINIGGASTATTTVAGGNVAHTVNIAAAGTSTIQAVTVGSTGSTSTLVLQGGTGTATGDINIGDQTTAGKIIDIGSVDNAGTGTVHIATGAAAQTVTIGSTNSSSTTTIQGGTGNINLTVAAGSVSNVTKIVGSGGTFQMTGPSGISSGATTMTATSGNSTFTTSASLTLNAGDYIIPTTTTGQARVVTATATGTSFSVSPAFSAGVTAETFAVHRPIANFLTSGGATGMAVQGSTGYIGAGTVAPTRQLDVAVNNSTINGLPLLVEQAGTGDVGIELKTTGKNFYVGVDNTDGQFKLSSAAAGSTITQMYNAAPDHSGSPDSGNVSMISAVPVTASASGTLNSIVIYIANNGTGHMKVALYDATGAGGAPNNVLAISGSQTLTANSFNTFAMSGVSITNATNYWLAFNVDDGAIQYGTNSVGSTPRYSTGGSGTHNFSTNPFPNNPATTQSGGTNYSIYMNVAGSAASDNFNASLLSMSDTGATRFQNSLDSTAAFQVQNAAGTNLIGLDTSGAILNLGVTGTTATASTVNIATSTGATQTINLGSTGSANAAAGTLVNIQGGTTASTAVKIGTNGAGGITVDTGTTGSILIGAGTSNNAKTITIGPTATKTSATTIQIGVNTAGTETISLGSTGSANAAAGTTVNIQGGTTANTAVTIGTNGAGGITIDSGTTGNVNIGTGANSKTVTVGSTSGTSKLLLQSGTNNVVINTAGTVRATFDSAGNNLYLGNGLTAAAPNNFTVQGTGSTTTAVAGGSLTVQGGNATVGNANGGSLTLAGGSGFGTGVQGIVVINTPTFATASSQSCGSNCTITQANMDSNGAVIVNATAASLTVTMPDPTITTAGRIVYVTAANGSNDFTLSVNGGGTGNQIAMRQNTTATMIWNGADWTAAGASSSTTLQAAYDNTLTSAGGAELVVSNGANANGLTIRDSTSNPINGTLLEVQTQSAANLLSANANVTDYASNGGAETAGATSSTFPSSTWAAVGSTTLSRYTTTGGFIATGAASVSVATTTAANDGVKNTLTTTLTANQHYNASFTTRLSSGTFTDMSVYYSIDGTTASVACKTGQIVATSVWTKVNCAFTAPSSGITSSNAILIRQTGSGTARTFYVDNLSITIAADLNYATDGGVDDSGNFATNWSFVNATSGTGSVSRNTSDGNDASDSAGVTITGGAANAGLRNKLSINPLVSTLYRVSVYAKVSSGSFTDFKVRYSRDGSTGSSGNYVDCVDYNTQTLSTSAWTQITCYITTDSTAPTSPYVNFVEATSAARTFYVDTFSMTLASTATPNVQIGGGLNGGPTTLFTLDRAASAPIAANNDAFLGSMYYDTTLGKLQCYEADGWGACGSSPDVIVTLSPEYTNAVLHGPSGGTVGVGTMTSDICSDALNINDGSSSQPTICGTNETYNFYKWTSPQPTSQTYGIYVTYQLPSTFKSFASGSTSVMGRTDNGSSGGSATVVYKVYRNNSGTGLTQCGSTVSVSSGTVSSWQIGLATGAADPSTCSFAPGDSIVFEIDMTASKDANSYVGNLGFTFSNK